MGLMEFEKWLQENHPDEWKTKELLDDFYIWQSKPLNDLMDACPWLKEKRMLLNNISFRDDEIKDLIDKGYNIEVTHDVNKDKHYECSCNDYEYNLYIQICKDDSVILEFYEQDTESFHYIVEPFIEFESSGKVKVYDAV